MRRPRLSHSSTFFTWLRLAYPQIRALLSASLYDIQMKMMTSELDRTRAIRVGQVTEKMNRYRSNYIHLLNLQTLFEFCLPAIQDYGSLLKNNDFLSFNIAFHNLLLLFILCRNKGSHDYQRTMLVFAYFFGTGKKMVCQLWTCSEPITLCSLKRVVRSRLVFLPEVHRLVPELTCCKCNTIGKWFA